jgi:hypothetical protein
VIQRRSSARSAPSPIARHTAPMFAPVSSGAPQGSSSPVSGSTSSSRHGPERGPQQQKGMRGSFCSGVR